MITLTELEEKLKPFRNTLVVNNRFEVVRLVGIVEDEFDGYYWEFGAIYGMAYASYVDEWIPLKGFIDQDKYEKMLRVYNMNSINKAI